jgi:hypothetical protein
MLKTKAKKLVFWRWNFLEEFTKGKKSRFFAGFCVFQGIEFIKLFEDSKKSKNVYK